MMVNSLILFCSVQVVWFILKNTILHRLESDRNIQFVLTNYYHHRLVKQNQTHFNNNSSIQRRIGFFVIFILRKDHTHILIVNNLPVYILVQLQKIKILKFAAIFTKRIKILIPFFRTMGTKKQVCVIIILLLGNNTWAASTMYKAVGSGSCGDSYKTLAMMSLLLCAAVCAPGMYLCVMNKRCDQVRGSKGVIPKNVWRLYVLIVNKQRISSLSDLKKGFQNKGMFMFIYFHNPEFLNRRKNAEYEMAQSFIFNILRLGCLCNSSLYLLLTDIS